MSFFRNQRIALAGLISSLAILAACAPAKTVKKETPESTQAEQPAAAMPPAADTSEGDIRNEDFSAIPELEPIRFAYDAYSLDDSARDALKKNAQYINDHPGMKILVTGNCDERGTVEYNLALGQRRAAAVREYYTHLGIDEKSVGTISYGKEKPVCTESTEACWAKNRRAETLGHMPKSMAADADQQSSANPQPAAGQQPSTDQKPAGE